MIPHQCNSACTEDHGAAEIAPAGALRCGCDKCEVTDNEDTGPVYSWDPKLGQTVLRPALREWSDLS